MWLLPHSGFTGQHDIVGTIDEHATVQLPEQGLTHLAGGKVEAGQLFVGWYRAALIWQVMDLTSRLAISALNSWESIGTAASKAGARSIRSLTTWAKPPSATTIRSGYTC
jgi:hypothetical protein